MAVTITHRHVHIPWLPIVAALVAAVIAIAVIALVANEPVTTTPQVTANASVVAVPGVAVVPKPEPAAWHSHAELVPAADYAVPAFTHPRNHVRGTTLGAWSAGAPTPYVDPYPFNHFMGEP